MPTWVYVLYVLLGLVALMVVGSIWIRVRTQQIAASRAGENFNTFCAVFRVGEAPPEVLRAVYGAFQGWCSDAVAAFPVRAADDIGDIYGMVDEDLEDAVGRVLAETGRRLPPDEQLRRMRPVVTVRDFVSFIEACPNIAEHAAAPDPARG